MAEQQTPSITEIVHVDFEGNPVDEQITYVPDRVVSKPHSGIELVWMGIVEVTEEGS